MKTLPFLLKSTGKNPLYATLGPLFTQRRRLMEFPKPMQTCSFAIHPRNFTLGEHSKTVAMELTKRRLNKLACQAKKTLTAVGKTYDWTYGVVQLTKCFPQGLETSHFNYDTLLEVETYFERTWRWCQIGTPQEHLLSTQDRFFKGFLNYVVNNVPSSLSPFFSKDELKKRLDTYYSTHPPIFDRITHSLYMKEEAQAVLEQWEKEGVSLKDVVSAFEADRAVGLEHLTEDTQLIGIDVYLETIEKKIPAAPRKLFERELEALQESKVHPLEKAARIWFFSLKHPSTPVGSALAGKALAELTLLSHGYYPPRMTDHEARQSMTSLELFTHRIIEGVNYAQKSILPRACSFL